MLKTIKQWLGGKNVASQAEPAVVVPPAQWADRALDLGPFERIEARGRVWVEWSPGADMCVATADMGDQEAHPLAARVENGTLIIEQPEGSAHAARVKVSSKRLDGFDCRGDASGAAQGLDADIFEARLENGSRMLLSGRAVAARLWIAGTGSLDADQLVAHAVSAKATAAGQLDARAESIAEAIIGGGGEIVIKGDPAVAKIERVGDGRAKIGSRVGLTEEENPGGIFDQMPLPRQ